MPKAFFEDELDEQGTQERDHGLLPLLGIKVGLAELFAFITMFYFATFTAFNAGYFSEIPGRFSDLFTFTDLLSTNISIIQFFVFVYLLFFVFQIGASLLVDRFAQGLPLLIEKVALAANTKPLFGAIVFVFFILLAVLSIAINKAFGLTSLTLALLPLVLLQGTFSYILWIGYKFSHVHRRTLITSILLGLFMFSYNSGSTWLRHDVSSKDGIQAIFLQDGLCINRKILRTSSSGILLYSQVMKQFEFRNKDGVRTIFDKADC